MQTEKIIDVQSKTDLKTLNGLQCVKNVHRLQREKRKDTDSHRKNSLKIIKVFKERSFKKSHIEIKNTQGVWILYGTVLSLNFLTADE